MKSRYKQQQFDGWLKQLKLHDCCKHHARDFSETQALSFPPSQHSPNCTNYLRERFAMIQCNGQWYVTEWDDRGSFDDDQDLVIGEVWITRDQYELMNEFQGF